MNKLSYKNYYDRSAKPLKANIGDEVLLINEIRSKLEPIYKKGYIMVDLQGVNAVLRNKQTNKLITVHKNRIRKCN